MHGRVNKVFLYSAIHSYFLDLEKKWSLSTLLSFWEKKPRPKGFYTVQRKFLYKENSDHNFYFCNLCFFCYVNNRISATWGIMFQPATGSNNYHTLSDLDWVFMLKHTSLSEIESFVVLPHSPPSLECPMISSLQPNNVSKF